MQTHRLKHWYFSSSERNWGVVALSAALGGMLMVVGFLVWSVSLPSNKVAAGVALGDLGDTELGGQTASEVAQQIEQTLPASKSAVIRVTFEDLSWQTDTQTLGLHLDTPAMTQEALAVGRTGAWWQQLRDRWQARWFGYQVEEQWAYDSGATEKWIKDIAVSVDSDGKVPMARLQGSQVIVDSGERGLVLDQAALKVELSEKAGRFDTLEISAPVEVTITPLSADGVQATQARAEKLKGVTLRIVADPTEPPLTIPASEFFNWLTWPDGYNTATLEAELTTRTAAWNREPVNAELVVAPDGKKLTTFVPERMGRSLELSSLVQEIQNVLNQAHAAEELAPQPTVVAATFTESAPTNRLEATNTLGIKERIAVGTSEYKGSIPNRIFNVGHTAEKVHGTLIAPGEEFSFNESVGDISAATGFKSAYVIMNGRTQLGDGGGVCQVSTTLFRAALNGGLPITRWKAHSYRVGYYEQGTQPGFDATVYAPSVDFRFRNDTGNTIAVAAYPDSTSQFLTIELWGTSDGRQSEISDYKIWNQRSAPAPMFVDDPNLPAGRRQQIDWAAAGANASFRYVVKDVAGQVLHDREFVSVFRPWQAVYLVGTGQ